jgi:hypothetical protein
MASGSVGYEVSQGIGGICAISVNDQRIVLDVIGQLHREYAGRN